MTCLEKNIDDINRILETDLVKKILDIAKENSMYKFEGSDRTMS